MRYQFSQAKLYTGQQHTSGESESQELETESTEQWQKTGIWWFLRAFAFHLSTLCDVLSKIWHRLAAFIGDLNPFLTLIGALYPAQA